MKGFRPKTLGERDAGPYDPRAQAGLWEKFFRDARKLGRAWEGCQACPPERRDPTAVTEVHHVVSQQRLKRWCREREMAKGSLAELRVLTDPRNSMIVDEWCHSGHTSRLRPLPRSAIPKYAWDFIKEKGLVAEVLDDYPRGET